MVLVKGFCLLVEVLVLIFNAVFITAVQQSEFDVCLCVYSFKKFLFHYGLS